MSELNRRAFLTTAPAAALAAALPAPEPEAGEEEKEYPHATGWDGERKARHALPEELHLLRCMVAASKAIGEVLKKHGPGCDDLAGCMVCHDAKAAQYAVSTACDMISGDLLGTWKTVRDRFIDE